MATPPTLDRRSLSRLPSTASVEEYLAREPSIGIVHFGVGNFHRSHQAMYIDLLMRSGLGDDWAICGIGLMERDRRMGEVLTSQDGLYTLTLRHPDGREDIDVVGSIRRFLHKDDGSQQVIAQMAAPTVRIVSLTITEGGYFDEAISGQPLTSNPLVTAEVATNLAEPQTAFGFIVEALRIRRERGFAPFTVMSCDNIQGNGRMARSSVLQLARLVDDELASWIEREVAFPSTMVDRITPATEESDLQRVRQRLGVNDAWPVCAEPFTQWILEDDFPAGRPPLEAVGATFTDDIEGYEAAKLRLLNGAHQAVAYIGQLAGYEYVDQAMADHRVRSFVESYMSVDAVPSFAAPSGLDVAQYCRTVVERFGNSSVQDPLSRLSVDSSDRVPIFVIPVALDRRRADGSARYAAAVLATWCVYWTTGTVDSRSSDRGAARMIAAAERAVQDPRAFLDALPGLAPLADDERFLTEFTSALGLLQSGGAKAFLTVYGGTHEAK
ncbi:mannitol dehydrogenase family protein [Arthrobacter psychrolactophilus]|nr:mannitol dehydrogenase family protein [Arthrobacter psychrolactophilus]